MTPASSQPHDIGRLAKKNISKVKYYSRIESENEIFGVLHGKYPWLCEALKDEEERRLAFAMVSDWFRRLRTLDLVNLAFYARGLRCYEGTGFSEILRQESDGGHMRSTRTLDKYLSNLKVLNLVLRDPERGGRGRRGVYHFCLPAILLDEVRRPVDMMNRVYFVYEPMGCGEATFRITMLASELSEDTAPRSADEIVERLLEIRNVADRASAGLLSASLAMRKGLAHRNYESGRRLIENRVTEAYWKLIPAHAEEAAEVTRKLRERLCLLDENRSQR